MEELGIDTIPVFVYPTYKRSRHYNQEFLEKFHDKVLSEDGFPIVMNGNYFIVDTKVYALGRREADLDDLEKRWVRPQYMETQKKSLVDDDGHTYHWSEPLI